MCGASFPYVVRLGICVQWAHASWEYGLSIAGHIKPTLFLAPWGLMLYEINIKYKVYILGWYSLSLKLTRRYKHISLESASCWVSVSAPMSVSILQRWFLSYFKKVICPIFIKKENWDEFLPPPHNLFDIYYIQELHKMDFVGNTQYDLCFVVGFIRWIWLVCCN